MKQGTRLYINILNMCNTNCPFCCMYSGTDKKTVMSFQTYCSIVDSCKGEFELQLEGGEPLLHEQLYLFIEYAVSTKRCTKISILTNGLVLERHVKRIAELAVWYGILIELKISINYWLIDCYASQKQDADGFLKLMHSILLACADMEFIKVIFNVRKRIAVDEGIDKRLKQYGLFEQSNIFYLQSYGKMTDSDYDKPVIVQNIADWQLYASDGTCFGQELIARSEHEKMLD